MKPDEVKKLMEAGFIGFVAEYRGSKAESISYVDKQSGRQAVLKTLRHNLEVQDQAIAFNERVPDTFKVEEYKNPFNKGQKVLVHLTALQSDKGVLRASGRLEALV